LHICFFHFFIFGFWFLVFGFYAGKTFLGRKLFPAPLSKNFQTRVLFFVIISALDCRTHYVRTKKLSRLKVFGATFFQKGSEKRLTQTNYYNTIAERTM